MPISIMRIENQMRFAGNRLSGSGASTARIPKLNFIDTGSVQSHAAFACILSPKAVRAALAPSPMATTICLYGMVVTSPAA
jgi:hypothetical protein